MLRILVATSACLMEVKTTCASGALAAKLRTAPSIVATSTAESCPSSSNVPFSPPAAGAAGGALWPHPAASRPIPVAGASVAVTRRRVSRFTSRIAPHLTLSPPFARRRHRHGAGTATAPQPHATPPRALRRPARSPGGRPPEVRDGHGPTPLADGLLRERVDARPGHRIVDVDRGRRPAADGGGEVAQDEEVAAAVPGLAGRRPVGPASGGARTRRRRPTTAPRRRPRADARRAPVEPDRAGPRRRAGRRGRPPPCLAGRSGSCCAAGGELASTRMWATLPRSLTSTVVAESPLVKNPAAAVGWSAPKRSTA